MFFHLISHSPSMCQRYLSISCVSSSSFPDVLSVLTFHVPTLMLFLVRSLFGPPVAYLSPPPWCAVEGAVLVDPGDDRAGMGWMVVVIHAVCLGQKSMAEPVPLHAGPQPISSNICIQHCSLNTAEGSCIRYTFRKPGSNTTHWIQQRKRGCTRHTIM